MVSYRLEYVLLLVFIATVNAFFFFQRSPWETNSVVPEVISHQPKRLMKIRYGNIDVSEGNELTPTQVKTAPSVSWRARDDELYTLVMTDPDVPTRFEPMFREWRHWIVGNIPGDDVTKGDTLASYMAIGPPLGSGIHRYVFLAWRQSGRIKFDEPILGNSCHGRPLFSTKEFAEKYSLGHPRFGNFFVGQYDDYSQVVQKEIGMKITKVGNETKYECI